MDFNQGLTGGQDSFVSPAGQIHVFVHFKVASGVEGPRGGRSRKKERFYFKENAEAWISRRGSGVASPEGNR